MKNVICDYLPTLLNFMLTKYHFFFIKKDKTAAMSQMTVLRKKNPVYIMQSYALDMEEDITRIHR